MKTSPLIHTSLASGRWNTFTLAFQLANVGSDFGRALRGKLSGDEARMWPPLERCLELLDLTIADPKHRTRLRELCRLREVICDFFIGGNEYRSTGESLDRYFLAFNVAAQKERGNTFKQDARLIDIAKSCQDSTIVSDGKSMRRDPA